jgi:hypothetical protein
MTTHTLARLLLEQEDIPVVINGWGSCEGQTFEVLNLLPETVYGFEGPDGNSKTGEVIRLVHWAILTGGTNETASGWVVP